MSPLLRFTVWRSPLALCLAALALAGAHARQQTAPVPAASQNESRAAAPASSAASAGAGVEVQMRNVNFRFDPELVLYIHRLDGKLVPSEAGSIPSFDEKRSFAIEIASAEVALDTTALTHLLNAYVFADPASGLKKIQDRIEGNQIKQKGTMHKGVDVPVELAGTVSVTADGKIRIHPRHISAAHLPFKGLMGLFGIKVSDFINQRKIHGLAIEKNDLILDPEVALPPPHIRARATGIRLEGDRLVLTLGHEGDGVPPTRLPEDVERGYMSYRSGVLKFGKLTMRPVDLTILNRDQQGPFDFFLDHYQQQLVAGTTHATPNYGWLVYMPGYGQLTAPRSTQQGF